MTEYLAVCVHQDFWRGNLHKWSTVYPFVGVGAFSGTTAVDAVANIDNALCYPDPTAPGQLLTVSIYDLAAKGSPTEVGTYNQDYTGNAWTSDLTRDADPLRETSCLIEWPGGMSRTGKPVTFKKWIHAVPKTAAVGDEDDISSTDATAIAALAVDMITVLAGHGLAMGNARRFAGSAVTVRRYYEVHQMPRGRKRKS